MAIRHQVAKRFKTKNDEIVAGLREAAGAAPPTDPALKVKRLTAEVAVQMALLHGGDWRVQIDHEVGLIVVARRRKRRRGTHG